MTVEVDLSEHVSLQVGALQFFGVWFYIPYSLKTSRFWLIVICRIIVVFTFLIVPTGAQLIYLIKLLISHEAEIQEVAGIINLVLTEMLTSFKLFDLCLRRGILTRLITLIVSNELHCYYEGHKKILLDAIKTSRRLFIALILGVTLDIAVHVVIVPALQGFKTLPLKMDFIYVDVNDEPYFKYVCFYQILYKPMMLTIYVSLQSFPWAAMVCANSQLDVLIYNFENMKELVKATRAERDCDENEAFKFIFKRCVLHQCSIIRFFETIQATFSGQLTANLILNGSIICTTAIQMISIESPMKNKTVVFWILAYLFIMVFNMFIDCYLGNEIAFKSSNLATVVYSCPWIDLSLKEKRNLIMFISRTQQPLVITAASLVPVSIETFTKVMNWTYKVFAVMNQMKK